MRLLPLVCACVLAACAGGVGEPSSSSVARSTEATPATTTTTPGPTTPTSGEESTGGERSITVGGIGEEFANPDHCVLSLGVESRESTVLGATRAASAAGEALIAALGDYGVADDDIQTTQFNIEPYYSDYPVIAGYESDIGYRVTMDDIDHVGSVLKAAVTAGGDDVRAWDIRFETDAEDLLEPARQEAWDDAERRGRDLAGLIGVPLGEVLDVHEKVLLTSPQGMVQGGEGDSAPFDIPASPGMSGVVVLLTVTFSIGD